MAKEKLSFYDVKSKQKFTTDDYTIKEKKTKSKKTGKTTTRYFAVAKSKVGSHTCWRVLSGDQAAKLK
ncbi:hypothetical protein AMJ49_05120 [Parcubacteria bacterium DG_74_2]|nr:MAG: hypothetical protein AMJ49_05120 [Parcubacteria bacterium DG_74_2]